MKIWISYFFIPRIDVIKGAGDIIIGHFYFEVEIWEGFSGFSEVKYLTLVFAVIDSVSIFVSSLRFCLLFL